MLMSVITYLYVTFSKSAKISKNKLLQKFTNGHFSTFNFLYHGKIQW